VIIGAVVGILLAILDLIPGYAFGQVWSFSIGGIIWTIAWSIIDIILCIGLIGGASSGNKGGFRISMHWFVLFVIGLIILVPNVNWGGLIVIIAGIVALL